MKKSLVAILLLTGLASVLSANEWNTKVAVGASAAEVNGESYTQYGVGYTATTTFENQIIFGFGNTLSYGRETRSIEVLTLDADLKVGYELITNLTAFAIGTGVVQSVENNSAYGLGYGGALEYRITNNVALEGSYKTIDMTNSSGDYDYDISSIAVKFNY